MIAEQELKERCTPEFIRWMCELAEGFSNYEYNHSLNRAIFDSIYHDVLDKRIFPLLIRRAVDGWNNKNYTANRKVDRHIRISRARLFIFLDEMATAYEFNNYKKENLTQSENTMLHCLLDVFAGIK